MGQKLNIKRSPDIQEFNKDYLGPVIYIKNSYRIEDCPEKGHFKKGESVVRYFATKYGECEFIDDESKNKKNYVSITDWRQFNIVEGFFGTYSLGLQKLIKDECNKCLDKIFENAWPEGKIGLVGYQNEDGSWEIDNWPKNLGQPLWEYRHSGQTKKYGQFHVESRLELLRPDIDFGIDNLKEEYNKIDPSDGLEI